MESSCQLITVIERQRTCHAPGTIQTPVMKLVLPRGAFFTFLPFASCSESSYTAAPAEPIHSFSYLILQCWVSNAGPRKR